MSDLLTCYSILTFKKLNWTLIIPICVYLLLENVEATSKRETISWDMFVVISYKEFCPLLNFSNEASVTAFPINEPSSLIKCGGKPVPWLLVNCLAEQL